MDKKVAQILQSLQVELESIKKTQREQGRLLQKQGWQLQKLYNHHEAEQARLKNLTFIDPNEFDVLGDFDVIDAREKK